MTRYTCVEQVHNVDTTVPLEPQHIPVSPMHHLGERGRGNGVGGAGGDSAIHLKYYNPITLPQHVNEVLTRVMLRFTPTNMRL